MGDAMEIAKAPLQQVFLQPGQFFLAREPTVISTILGSCVGVTFWSKRLHVGALCHALLPTCPEPSGKGMTPETGRRYVDYCIRDLIRQFYDLGVQRKETEVKLFGGADMFAADGTSTRPTVGRMNYETALEVLRAEGFNVIASNLGETVGRKIKFNTATGDVMLLRLT
jgi:chemotaxis protein CheD